MNDPPTWMAPPYNEEEQFRNVVDQTKSGTEVEARLTAPPLPESTAVESKKQSETETHARGLGREIGVSYCPMKSRQLGETVALGRGVSVGVDVGQFSVAKFAIATEAVVVPKRLFVLSSKYAVERDPEGHERTHPSIEKRGEAPGSRKISRVFASKTQKYTRTPLWQP
jgi:hypothetical protein